MKMIERLALMFFALLVASLCHADPTSGAVHVISLRPYTNVTGATGGQVYVRIDNSTFCGTDTYMINLNFGGGKEMYAAALSAMLTGKSVQLEVLNSSGCAGWGTTLQSIIILNQ